MTTATADAGKVTREIQDHLFLIGLDRAAKRNAFDSSLITDLSLALTEYEQHTDLRCAIIFAHGEHFTAGLDLLEIQDKLDTGLFAADSDLVHPWGTTGRQRSKPLIVAVHGYCFTAGIELMLNADLVIAHADTQFAQMEVLRGILPFGGATVRFVRNAGWQQAMRYLMTGERFDAETALKLNLVTEITREPPLQRAKELALQITAAAPLAVQATLAAAQDGVRLTEAEAMQRLSLHLKPLLKSHDAQEGVQSMLEKRPPRFTGK